jgi:hypothetical protein
MEKKFSVNDLNVIKGYDALTDNQLDEIKGGITLSLFANCSCDVGNANSCEVNEGGKCKCKSLNANGKDVAIIIQQ